MASVALYTPEVLELATSLANFRWDESLSFKGTARSRSCGSTLELGLSTDAQDRIDRLGLRSQACAIGQAAAAIFAKGATGRTPAEIRNALAAMRDWLAGEGPQLDPEMGEVLGGARHLTLDDEGFAEKGEGADQGT